MGMLVDGQWQDVWYDTQSSGGRFVRSDSQYRNWVTQEGSAGPTGEGGFQAEAGRYHLYVSLACPWAHRVLIVRALKGLEEMIPISVVHWLMAENGWTFADGPGVIGDPINQAKFLHQVYTAADAQYSGRVTVPLLWDRKTGTIVNNESSEILRMLSSAFDPLGAKPGNFYPDSLRTEIDAVNARVYEGCNNGVYKAGFATRQEAYEEAVAGVFDTLDWVEARLSGQPWLAGDLFTEADIRLFTTLVRFDEVYHGHFKCNRRRIVDFPDLWAFTRRIYQMPGISGTVNMEHIKRHYHESHRNINPTGIVPVGPGADFTDPSGLDLSARGARGGLD